MCVLVFVCVSVCLLCCCGCCPLRDFGVLLWGIHRVQHLRPVFSLARQRPSLTFGGSSGKSRGTGKYNGPGRTLEVLLFIQCQVRPSCI